MTRAGSSPVAPEHPPGTLQCPHCESGVLVAAHLDYGLPAVVCNGCGGAAVSMLSYRAWQSLTRVLEAPALAAGAPVADTTRVLRCPRCHHYMRKYRISADAENRIDLCVACDEAWFDDGEWALTIRLRMHDRLHVVLTERWQTQVRREQAQRQNEERYRELFGADQYDAVRRLRDWIRTHPQRSELLDYLMRP